MPRTTVLLFKELDGNVPLEEWFETIRDTAVARCLARLRRLEELGHELRRPEADFLRDGIYELRIKDERMQYRILYFFHGNQAVVVSHGFIKKVSAVPASEIRTTLRRKKDFERNPAAHTAE